MEREEIFRFVREKYGIEPDYPFSTAADTPVFRHPENRKWFALVMAVGRDKLGLSGTDRVDVMNVKIEDPFYREMVMQEPGCLPGYHMQAGLWVSVLLDGSVAFPVVCALLEESYRATSVGKRSREDRAAKAWLVPANPKYYDVEHAFDQAEEIDWKQGNGIRKGDTVYLYVGAPVSAILFQCRVTRVEIPYRYQDENLTIRSLMRLRLLRRYPADRFPFSVLRDQFDVSAIRGPRGLPHSLQNALQV